MAGSRLIRAVFVLVVAGMIPLLCGCIRVPRESIDIQRYAIDPERHEEERAAVGQPITIRILPFGVSASLRGDRILFRGRAHRLDPYFYHRWIAPPARLLEDLLARSIESWGIAKNGVIHGEIAIVPTHEVHGRLIELYADNRLQESSARLEIELTMVRVDRKTLKKEVVFQKSYTLEEDQQDERVPSFIEATNRLADRWLRAVRADLGPVLAKEGDRSD